MNGELQNQKITGLDNLIQKGIVYEDDFIALYMKLIKDEGFLEIFPAAARGEVKKYLEVLIKESSEHKNILEKIVNNLK